MAHRFRNPISALVFALLLFAGAPRAEAMIVLAVDLPNLIVESDTIVQGVVMHLDNVVLDKDGNQLSQEEIRNVQNSSKRSGIKAFTDISILVGQNYRGNTPPGKVLKIRMVGGKIGGFTLAVPGMPTFRPKEEVVLFLERTPQGLTPMGAAQGVFRVERKHESAPAVHHDLLGVAVLRPSGLPDHCDGTISDAAGCSGAMTEGLPAIPDRMPLATLRDHIHAVLGTTPSTPKSEGSEAPRLP